MRKLMLMMMLAVYVTGETSHAYWGTGMYMGAPMCPYPYGGGTGAADDDDDVYQSRKERDRAKREWNKAKREHDAAKKLYDRYDASLKKRLNGRVLQDVKEHMERGYSRDQWLGACEAGASANTPGGNAQPAGGAQAQPAAQPSVAPVPVVVTPSQINQATEGRPGRLRGPWCSAEKTDLWQGYYAEDGGDINPAICADSNPPQIVNKNSSTEDRIKCEIALKEYGKAFREMRAKGETVASAEENYVKSKLAYESAREAAKAKREDGDDEDDSYAESDCPSGRCRGRGRTPSTLETVGSIGLAVLGGVLGYKGAKYAIDQNSRLGWPSNPYLATGAAYPLMSMGIYGALGGGIGPGAFGCAGTIGGAGAMGAIGMGMGPFGLYGGINGGAFGYPPGMFGPMMGGGMWNPGMFPGGGFMNPFMNPMMMGMGGMNPMMGMGGMNPFMMNPFGNPMMGMGGMNPMMGMMNPMMGGMPGMMPFPGAMGPGMGMGMPGMGGPFQMQMMQQYMSQMQMQMQMQQAQMQDQMYRQQTVMSLQTEMYRIQQQIYMISSGSYGGYGGGGASVLPYPGASYPGSPSPGYPGTPPYVPGPYPGNTTPYYPRTGR
jgi:hypothetical protein